MDSLHPLSFPFCYSQWYRNTAEQKHFNLTESLASICWHWSFSFNPTLAKKTTRHTYSQMRRATENNAEWNYEIWACNILWTCARGSMLMKNLLWVISIAKTKQDSSWPPSLALSTQKWITEPGCKVLTHCIYFRNCHQPALPTDSRDIKAHHATVTSCRTLHFWSKTTSAENSSL